MQRYISGQSLRKIAESEHRDRATIAKIVKSPEVAGYIEALREKFYGALEIAMDSLLDELRNPNSRARGWSAFEALKNGGVIPNTSQLMELESRTPSPDPDSEQAAIKRMAVDLVEGALVRQRYFGIPLPEADEAERSPLVETKALGGRDG
jgi:hypothetical protein